MKFPTFLVTIVVTCAIQTHGLTKTDRRVSSIEKRQTTNADQMVQNILQWLQGVYAENSRRVRQGTVREYLPPSNTEKPRPFQPGYPPAGYSPEPSFPFPTNPATGGITAPEGYRPEGGDNGLIPPDTGSGDGHHVPEILPGSTLITNGPYESTPSGPTGVPEQPTGYPSSGVPTEEQPGSFPTHPGGIPSSHPTLPIEEQPVSTPTVSEGISTGYPTSSSSHQLPGDMVKGHPSEEQPGFIPTHPGGATPEQPIIHTIPTEGTTGYPAQSTPEAPFTSHPVSTIIPDHQTQPSVPPFTSPEGGTHPPPSTGYPSSEQPQFTHSVKPEESSTTIQSSGGTHELINPPGSNLPPQSTPEAPGTTLHNTVQPAVPEGTHPTEAPAEPAPGSTLPTSGTSIPSGFTVSTVTGSEGTQSPVESETSGTTANPESNTIPGPGTQEPSLVDDDESKHPPHIHAIDVQCSKEMMTINIEFNREFNGVIYSKGYYSNPECRYVQENSGQTKYTFTVNLNMCGTEFVNAFDTQNQSYLENILVLQNEVGIQEVWDTVRSVRCLWEGNLKDTLSVAFSIGMLSQEIVTFSGDTAMAKLDVLLGRGPLGEPANGLVKIGEQMTLTVAVSGDPGFDVQVKDCKAVDAEGKNSIALTDEDGCILKPKLFGAFQKTRETGNSGASIIAYAYFNAFKFPDEMDIMIECNIELCKSDCEMCKKDGQQLEPNRRRRRDVSYNNTVTGDWVTMGKLVRVILPEDLSQRTALEVSARDHICLTIQSFVFSTAILVSLLVITSFVSICLWMKRREKMYAKY